MFFEWVKDRILGEVLGEMGIWFLGRGISEYITIKQHLT
jgi:hypothetical protein